MGIAFDRIVMVMMENAQRSDVIANPQMNQLRKKGVFLAASHGVTHPSQPNYVAAVGGDTFGVHDDNPNAYAIMPSPTGDPEPPVTCIADLLEAHGLTWKSYAEDIRPENLQLTPALPPFPEPPEDVFPFARKHVPFLLYPGITSVPERLARIVDAREFEADLAAGQLPTYSWYTPNLINDGHSTVDGKRHELPEHSDRRENVENVAAFLQRFLGDDPVARFPPETLIVITWDESYPGGVPYEVFTLLIGDMLEPGTTRFEPYNHYSLLRSVEDNFGVGTLGRGDAAVEPLWFLRK